MDGSQGLAFPGPIPRLYGSGTLSGLGEGQLLGRFVDQGDPSAFEALVSRHGPMVLGVCHRRLRDPNDADDAFQATFLILARKASTLRDREALGPWLYGVAHRVASRARLLADRRARRFRMLDREPIANGGEILDERLIAMDEEIARLPEVFRAPIVLCHLEGCTYREAADRLRWSEGTVRGRLARGRERLRERLSRRGYAQSIEERPSQPSPSSALMLSTVAMVANQSAPGAVPVAVACLAGGVLRSMLLTNPKVVGSLALAMVSAVVVAAQDPAPKPSKTEAVASKKDETPPDLAAVRKALDSWWETLETLSFRQVGYTPDAEGRFDPTGPHGRTDFAYARADRFSIEMASLNQRPGVAESLSVRKRWDGKTYYHFVPLNSESADIHLIIERPESSDTYRGEVSYFLNLVLLTGNKRDHSADFNRLNRLEVERDPGGPYRVFLVGEKKPHYQVRTELDPEHGWMPKRYWVQNEKDNGTEFVVTKFRKVAGHWFPIEGVEMDWTQNGRVPGDRRYEVIDLHVNEPIPDSRFNRDDFPGIDVLQAPPVDRKVKD